MQVGVDLGSRTVKIASFFEGSLTAHEIIESGFQPHKQAEELLKKYPAQRVVATGYGRHLAQKHFAEEVITEIKAHALGARHFFPDCRLILDIGGQDSKVITLNKDGKVLNFKMNDKCAAGTGRFLEIMAQSLGYALEEFGPAAETSCQPVPINSMCAVFAESEVISLKNHGTPPNDIARSIHLSVIDRVAGMLERAGLSEYVVFTGGVAKNKFLVSTLSERLGIPVKVPEFPDAVGAIGAAIYAGMQ